MSQLGIESSFNDDLASDHERLAQLFSDVHRLVDIGEWLTARAVFDEWAAALRRHLAVEERLLFVPLEQHEQMLGSIAYFRLEHRTIEHLLGRVRTAIETDDARRFGAAAADFAAVFYAHNQREEELLYPRAGALLSPAERARLVAALRVR